MKRPYTAVVFGTSLAVAGVFVVAAVRPDLLRTAHTMAVEDFGAYWIGTKVELAGGNAYDDDQLLPLEQEIEPDRTVVVAAWSPPWTFAALAPLAPLDFPTARWVWRFIQISTNFLALVALWRAYGGPPDRLI